MRNRLISTTDPNNITVDYGYDDNNNMTSLTDGRNNTRSWVYDVRNLQIQKIYPEAGDSLSYSYDALRRPVTKTDQLNDTTSYVYDLAGRVTSRLYKTGGTTLESTDTFTYDGASRLTTCHKGRYNVTTTHSYAEDSMPASEAFTIDGKNYTIQRSYDPGNRPLIQTFADGHVKAWSYDARNLVTNLTYDGEQVLSQSHDAGYRLTSQNFGNGLSRQISYARDDNYRTRDHVLDNNTAIASLDLSYTLSLIHI